MRRNGQQLFHAAPGTAPDNDAWIVRKTRVVDRFGRSSLNVGERARQAGTTFEEQMRLDPDLYAAHGGAFPVSVRGVGVIGTVAVSGLPQLEDHRLVVEVLSEFLGVPLEDSSRPPPPRARSPPEARRRCTGDTSRG